MNELSELLRNTRLSKNLDFKKVSDDTKIRPHILKDIEEGNFSSIPDVYLKSFLKILSNYYKIDLEAKDLSKKEEIKPKVITEPTKTEKSNENFIPNNEQKKTKPVDPAIAELAAQFKKQNTQKPKKVKKVNKVALSNYIIYGTLFIAILVAIVITIISLLHDDKEIEKIESNNKNNDTIKIEAKDDNLLTYFQNTDSLSLKAIAKDTAWLRLIIDDSKFVEELLRPGESKEWFASEQFVIDVGNAGAISFYRNGDQLPSLGKPGTVAKNIKITRDNVINITSIQPKDTTNVIKKPKIKKKKEEEGKKNPPPIIESTIQEEDNLFRRR